MIIRYSYIFFSGNQSKAVKKETKRDAKDSEMTKKLIDNDAIKTPQMKRLVCI